MVSGQDVLAASALDRAGRYREAAELLDAALDATASSDGDVDGWLVRALALRAGLHRFDGRLGPARDVLERARAVPESPPLAGVELAIELARVCIELGHLPEATTAVETAADRAAAMAPGSDRDVARARVAAARGTLLRVRGIWDEAEVLLRDAIAILQSVLPGEGTAGPAASELAHAYDELGMLHRFAGRSEASEAAYGRARAILVEHWGSDHPDLAAIEHNLGGLAHGRGDPASAERHARRSVEAHERTLGPDHVVTILDRSALAAILDQAGRHTEAKAMLEDVVVRLEATLGPDHRELAVALNNLAAIALRAGDLETAEGLYRRSIGIKEHAIGSDAPSLALTLGNLGVVRRRQGSPAEAAALYERAIAILEAAAEDHPQLDVLRRNLDRAKGAGGELSAP